MRFLLGFIMILIPFTVAFILIFKNEKWFYVALGLAVAFVLFAWLQIAYYLLGI